MRLWGFIALAACGSQSRPPTVPPPQPPAPIAAEAAAETNGSGDVPASDAPMVPPSLLEGYRVKGSILVVPDDMDKVELVKRNLTRVVPTSKLCIAADGAIASVTMLKSSGLPTYDTKIRTHMSDWRYKPFEINGKPAPVCTTVTFIYNQQPPPKR